LDNLGSIGSRIYRTHGFGDVLTNEHGITNRRIFLTVGLLSNSDEQAADK